MSVALECTDLRKGFGGSPVLKGVSLHLQPGTVTALAGENGAGKSVLMKIASGQYKADDGTITVDGKPLTSADPAQAMQLGVAIVPQELAPIADMTVYENLFLGREIKSALGLLDRRAMIRKAREMLTEFGADIDPTVKMRSLSVAKTQLVEIVKCTSRGAKVVLLDEPTSAISAREVANLYAVVNKLRDQNVAMLYTTHKMEEIRALADRVVVLRDGHLTLDKPAAEITDDEIVTAMIGRELDDLFPDVPPRGDEVLIEVEDVLVPGAGGPVSLSVRRGEILGLAGLVGAGRTELIEAIFGARARSGGAIRVAGRTIKAGSPVESIRAGMALVPEDRKGSGAVLSMSVADNGALPRLPQFTTAGYVRRGERNRAVGAATQSVRLKSRGLSQLVGTLSGGNQQKVVLARWLTGDVQVLLLDEPTRGVDVGARSEIYRIITDLASQGMAVLMASSDMPEILSLTHRSLVMRGGQVVAELSSAELARPEAQEVIFRLASGQTTDVAQASAEAAATDVTAVEAATAEVAAEAEATEARAAADPAALAESQRSADQAAPAASPAPSDPAYQPPTDKE